MPIIAFSDGHPNNLFPEFLENIFAEKAIVFLAENPP
jgi:hypothetical protein